MTIKKKETISNIEKLNKGIRIGKAIISVITFIISAVMLTGLLYAFVKIAGGATGAIVKAFIDGIKTGIVLCKTKNIPKNVFVV